MFRWAIPRRRGCGTAGRWPTTPGGRRSSRPWRRCSCGAEAWDELLALYRDAADRADDRDARKGYQFKIATIDEERRGDAARAIEDYRAILDTDPADRTAVERLDALLVRTEAWTDLAELLERRIADALDAEERAVFRFRLGKLRVERLDDPRGAVESFREILDERRDHKEAIRALEGVADANPELRLAIVEVLEPIYRELDDWRRLVVALNLRLAASEDPIERGQLLREIGTLKELRDGDVKAAFAAFSQAFAADPADGEAREAAERLAAEHGLWDDLVATYETALAATDDSVVQTDLLRAIASTHDQRRDDPRSAIDAYNRLFAIDETQLDVLDLLENLHVLLSDWAGHVEVLERKVARSLDDEIRTFLLRQIGEQQRDMLNDPDKAVDAFQRALEIDPGDVASLEALDGLYVARRDVRRLADVLQQRLDIEPDVELRRVTALRLGKLWEVDLDDAQRAIDAYRRVLDDVADDRDALGALERLYARQQSWSDLLENLRTQAALATDDAARTPLRLRIGALLAERLHEPESALEVYREVLEVEPGNTEAITAVRHLAEDDGHRAAAVEILEPLFRTARRWDDLVAVVALKLSGVDDPAARLTELKGLAQVHESGRGDLASAFATWRRALHEDPSDFDARMELERLAGALQRWADLVAVLEEESAATGDPTVGGELAVRAAELSRDRLEDDPRAVANYRRGLDIAGDTDEVLQALDELYARNSQWAELLEVLDRRVAIAAPEALDGLEVRVAALREKQFDDAAGALSAYRNVLDRTPTAAEALAGVERLLLKPSVRPDALEVLEAAYQRNDDVQRQAWLLELRVGDADLGADKVRLLGDLARLREDRLGDVVGALDAQVRAFGIDPRDEQTLSELERLAPAAGSWERLRGVVESALSAHTLEPMDVAALNLRAARWYLDHLEDAAAGEARLLATLDADPESLDALELLEGVRRAPGRTVDLVATLRRRAELELDVDARKRMLREAATLAETTLGDLDEAAAVVTALLDIDDADTDALDALARLRKAQGRHAEVAELLGRRARIADDPVQAVALRREVAELYAGPLNDVDQAVMAWRDLLDFEPNDLAARQSLEALLARAERWRDLDDALRGRLDAALSAEERASVRLELARLHETRFADLGAAADFLRDVLDESPTHVQAGNELERIYAAERRWSDLGELLERRADDYASAGDIVNELTILVRIGELSERELGDTARAVELYERVLARDPDHVGALRALARLAEGDARWDRAIEMLGRALSLAPSGAEGAALALHLARLQADRGGDLDAAKGTLFRALELDPSSAEALKDLKDLAARKQDDRLLATALEREVAVTPDPKAKVALLKTLAALGRDKLQDAAATLGWLEQAQAIDPDDRDVLLPLVDVYSSSGREGDAIPIIERIIASFGTRRSKELAQWQHRLGRAYEAGGDDLRALSLYDQAFKIDLTNVPILRDLGLLCLKTGDLERAQKTFRALLLQRLDPSHGLTKADVYFHLGDTLQQQGDKPKAIGMLERAVEADKTHARAVALLASLKA
jgi:tetratricopeptide (TPR) repeat protein